MESAGRFIWTAHSVLRDDSTRSEGQVIILAEPYVRVTDCGYVGSPVFI